MTLQEFKAWFEGFNENIKGQPSAKQWARIKERVEQIDGVVTTPHHFIYHYWRNYPQPYYPLWTTFTSTELQNQQNLQPNWTFNNSTAMYVLGKTDCQSIV